MNMPITPNVTAPPTPKTLAQTGLSLVMMRDILLKTIFRMNIDLVSDISRVIALSPPLTQELVDITRAQKLLEATGTLHATSGNEMGYQLTDSGKALAIRAAAIPECIAACLDLPGDEIAGVTQILHRLRDVLRQSPPPSV